MSEQSFRKTLFPASLTPEEEVAKMESMGCTSIGRIAKWLSIYLIGVSGLVAHAATVSEVYQREVAQSQKEVTEAFPEVKELDSPFNKAFREEVARARKEETALFQKTDWPMVIARRVDAGLNSAAKAGSEVAGANPAVTPRTDLPPKTDLRPTYEQLALKPRSQGARGSCTIFGTLGVMEFQLWKRGEKVRLSEQFVAWGASQIGRYKREGFACDDVIAAIQSFGVCEEELMPYKEWGNVGTPSKKALADAATRKGVNVVWFHEWSGSPGFSNDEIKAVCTSLAEGCPVTATFVWPRTAKLDKENYLLDRGSKAGSGHVVVLVGYEIDSAIKGGGAFIFRQSWGDDWGENGYARVTFQFVKENGQQAYALKVPEQPATQSL